ncbi:hypothetical protein CONPUDRAFT_166748 [Coniophora puteana RWD-64-598 SS2]|uniref:GATA-type domain-containing protein n=1 Tax=Coniophora puteana (strain RWD-64-598) TaxID=741705 RepID=A0A5M3MIM5_CONPW|nr:uncharacterized protein CONPUDRAFT_166748 [Coniophora puteana RWD-64-598 SS2]EIW78866.1 hypothetical protein CONPUDRAFT_166748 [Coniophora puteana RWD-64-598 SS2]
MPTRVESMPLPPSHRRDSYDSRPYDYGYSRRPSPPPIAAISHSPSLSVSSLDRSSVSSPAPRRSPTDHGVASDVHAGYRDPYYAHSSSIGRVSSRPYHLDSLRDSGRTHHAGSYSYPRPHAEHRYSHESHPYHVPSYSSSSVASYGAPRDGGLSSYPLPGQAYHQIGYTDDAATKLSDRMRRRCYNCSTTDTSTWRRSNLSPGKVLCNKCGLFERTHGRSRPEQFPHRRGPLATTTSGSVPSAMRPRSPGGQPSSVGLSTALPPISAHVGSLVPHQYTHPSIAPLSSIPDTRGRSHSGSLPSMNSWVDAGASRASGMYAPGSPGRLHELQRARSPPRFGHVDAEAAVA